MTELVELCVHTYDNPDTKVKPTIEGYKKENLRAMTMDVYCKNLKDIIGEGWDTKNAIKFE